MKYTYLGRTGLRVSQLCLGTMNFGNVTSESDAFRIMDAALDAGINFFDTANVYGWQPKGLTEEIIGRWFAQGGDRRERVVLATKIYGDMDDRDGPNKPGGVSAYKVRRHLDASLKRLQTDHVELYQMHHIDRHAPWEEVWGAFETQIHQGKVDYIGSSNFAGWHLVKAQAAAAARHFLGLVSEQHLYNLMQRTPELEVLPAARDLGLGVIPWSPLAGGLLGGNALTAPAGSRSAQRQKDIEKHRPKLEAFAAFCSELGEPADVVGLAWLLAQPGITAPIIGPRTIAQLETSLRAVELSLSQEALARLDTIFPGPGGAAPEAYAW